MPTEVSELGRRNYRPSPVLPAAPARRAIFRDGTVRQFGDGPPAFTFRVPSASALERLLATDAYSAAMAFVGGEFDVEGDLAAAIRFKGWQPRSNLRNRLLAVIARSATALESVFQNKARTARHIRFHYDRSNDFYRLFLDPRMVYSCAYFRAPEVPLEEAQLAKLDHICRKLDVRPGERFLDIGCGWGALLAHAAGRYGAVATGCTLSQAQYEFTCARLEGRARVLELDYRDLTGRYDKIASVGMFEHVGLRRASQYFRQMAALLKPDGLFLNHAIARPQGVEDDAGSLFVRRQIFPGGQLIHLSETIREAENAGFEVLDVENLRPHYARTCRLWQERLTANREAALRVADEPTFRAWRLWLAACSLSFEEGVSSVYQVLMAKRGSARRPLTREYMYGRSGE
jgi:cyclopropane-fatty-acyl-phospholipid synthase